MEQGPKHKVVMSSEIGINCWLPVRFCGGRCQRIEQCIYPEKKTCKAVDSEIQYLEERFRVIQAEHIRKILQLKEVKE